MSTARQVLHGLHSRSTREYTSIQDEPPSYRSPEASRKSGRTILRWVVMIGLGIAATVWLFQYRIFVSPGSRRPILTMHPSTWDERKGEVKEAFLHAYDGYMRHAFPADELAPVSGKATRDNNFAGWGVTLIDSLDTMWLMGLRQEFEEAIPLVANLTFATRPGAYIPFFEVTIRYLGGLLSAYALSGNPILLARADDLGRRLLPVFDAHSSGLPSHSIELNTGKTRNILGRNIYFAEATSSQLEFKYLAKLTGRTEYYFKVERTMDVLYQTTPQYGLFSEQYNTDTGKPLESTLSVGGCVDSGYEYLLKQWLQTGDEKAKKQYLTSVEGIINTLSYITKDRQLLFVTDLHPIREAPSYRFEHLSCFFPGLLALGVHTLDLAKEDKERHLWAAKGLAYTCYVLYQDQATGIGPDDVVMKNGGKWITEYEVWKLGGAKGKPPGAREPPPKLSGEKEYKFRNNKYLMRPETVESLYLLWKVTGDEAWRERGYTIFKAIEEHTRSKYGYSSIEKVDTIPPKQLNDMPSYFLAETLKYLYLLFDDSDPINLSEWVFNTEGHPLPVFEWNDWENEKYGITKR